MSFLSDIAGASEELAGELGSETFTWKGKEVVCVPNMLDAGSELTVGGFEVTYFGSLHVLKSVFLTVDSTLITVDSDLFTVDNGLPHPVAGKTLTFRGKARRILSASEDASRAYYVLKLIGPNK